MSILIWQKNTTFINRLVLLIAVFSSLLFAPYFANAKEISIANKRLEVSLTLPEGLLSVKDRESNIQWQQFLPTKHVLYGKTWDKIRVVPVSKKSLIQIDKAEVKGREIYATGTWHGQPFTICYSLLDDSNGLRVTIDSPKRAEPLPWKLDWAGGKLMTYPYAFSSKEAATWSVLPIDEGLIFSTKETDIRTDPVRWRYRWVHKQLSMPWYGVTDLNRGVMTRIDTPFDTMFSIQWVSTPWGERALPQMTWVASKGALTYKRSVTFRFVSKGGYNTMAKTFRKEMLARKQLRLWEDKIRTNPEVAKLRGALDLWYKGKINKQLVTQLQEIGIRHAIIARGAGNGIEQEGLKAAKKAGFLVGKYHNYTWIQGRWIDADPILKNDAALPASGKLKYHKNAFDAKGHFLRCSDAYENAFGKSSKKERDFGLNYFFTDCTTAGAGIVDCYDPKHPVSRRDAPANLRRALDRVGNLGMVVGSERGTWWATPSVHVFEGIETIIDYAGQFRGKGGEPHWVGPYFKDKPGYKELFLGVEFNPARHVPLFQGSSIYSRE